MSKDKRRVLFEKRAENSQISEKVVDSPRQDDSITGADFHLILKKELIVVFAIIILIGASFGAIYLTNSKSGWIERASQRFTKLLIRNF